MWIYIYICIHIFFVYTIGSDSAGILYFPSTDSPLLNCKLIFSAMATEQEPTAEERRLAAGLDINVEEINNDLDPGEESPASDDDEDCIPRFPDRIAIDAWWPSRGLMLIDKLLSDHWKQQIQSCANIRLEPFLRQHRGRPTMNSKPSEYR